MMKKLSVLSVVLVSIITALCLADYTNPPNWENNVDFTHQSWDFVSDQSSALPAAPDGSPTQINDFNTPGLVDIAYTGPVSWTCSWMDEYPDESVPTYRTGFYGGMGNSFLTFHVPNSSRDMFWKKQVWVQMTFHARKDGPQPYDIDIAHDAGFTDVNNIQLESLVLDEPNEPEGDIGKWYKLTAVYEIPAGTDQEYIRLSAYQYPPDANHTMGGATVIDQIDIDTRYVNIADFDESGQVDLNDFAIFASQWLK